MERWQLFTMLRDWLYGTSGSAPHVLTSDKEPSYGLSINRPDANEVREGFIYYSVDLDIFEYSNGTDWVVI